MENSLLVTSSPHIRCKDTTSRIMLDVVIALLPAAVSGVWFFGARTIPVILVAVLAAVASEAIACKTLGKDLTIGDFSAVVTGMLLALNLPPTIPLWIAAVGSVLAIVLVKQLFGGLGQNFMNPALTARVILLVSWPVQMTNWIIPDAVSSATPLAMIRGKEAVAGSLPSYLDLFLGKVGGSIGETSVLAILLGAAYLVYRRVITLEIPLTFIGTLALFTWIFGGNALFTGDYLYHMLSGGLMLSAFFMATDYTTSPITFKGRVIMGIGCGLLTGIIRLYTNYPEGVSFAILLMNILTPLIDRYTVPVSFGGEKKVA
ncbi:Na+-transporting NADH:ubiquinone oxidoreductase subunit D [Clostridium thermosuccinogenes]|uniref:Ion-translocating oxidoreductase complex subunit D n=1 Tax=Clostridium thermosuccinogenes TaxID=84032 RepID=A0A2K2FEB4_9CLOT|nr:RnfABCDGE type electron transport complex subunit D [Pseudoclostridium thermosuccinogenes]AUS98319.1 Na+-transporting NADH:ubiquinone oxidoreductase subunit D [Pseudoclostridium thermosuccinogenes]PNT95806.1 Na+-transporting NADH:ubiquinone oxidoreductase subunit D [Pseudoclostridium thermosuccinogenes]PNT97124.1 Na+-transporting NADH:ubiquinone oxidoreductase subunit D [Pseudoclostridium thermosuccinogenes]